MARHGFSVVFTKRVNLRLSPQAVEPGIGALFRWDSSNGSIAALVRDEETEPALELYIQQSRALETRIQAKIAALVDASKPLAVWGTGTHTLRLLETSSLPKAKIVAFIDSNVNCQGKTLAGVLIISPSDFKDGSSEILISSQTAEKEIFQMIANDLNWDNVIHRLYAD
jgi:FlaA1/EpsC-like NDP-sugar epimerase